VYALGSSCQESRIMSAEILVARAEDDASSWLLALHRQATQVLCAATAFEAGLLSVLEALTLGLRWRLGEIWTKAPNADVLVCHAQWPLPQDPLEFELLRHERVCRPGQGRPGRVFARLLAEISSDVPTTPTFPLVGDDRALSHVLCFPIEHQGRALGVAQLFGSHAPPRGEQLLMTMQAVGQQIGHFMVHVGSARAARESGIRKAAAVESAIDVIITVDQHGHVRDFNSAAEKMFGTTRRAVLSQPLHTLIQPTTPHATSGLVPFLGPGESTLIGKRTEMTARRADGTSFPVQVGLTRMARNGPPFHVVSVRDLTEEKQRHDELRRAIRERDDFLGVASHELRTPVTTLKLLVQSLQRNARRAPAEEGPKEPFASRLGEIGHQVDHLTRLIDNLLDVSRLTAGRLNLQLEEVDLSALVQGIVLRSQDDLLASGCTLSSRIVGGIVGRWDRLRLEQVVTNLLSNAMKYGMSSPIELELDGDDKTARLTVRDFGMGISADDQAHIFLRYGRAVPASKYGGLGLGLWIVRQIVDALEGRVEVESQPQAGSTFTVILPRAPRASP
jgi:PAS domain S-box-containing protein